MLSTFLRDCVTLLTRAVSFIGQTLLVILALFAWKSITAFVGRAIAAAVVGFVAILLGS